MSMWAKAICQLYGRWNRVVGKIIRPFHPIDLFALAELYYCPEVLGAGTAQAHEWLILLQLEVFDCARNKVHTDNLGGEE